MSMDVQQIAQKLTVLGPQILRYLADGDGITLEANDIDGTVIVILGRYEREVASEAGGVAGRPAGYEAAQAAGEDGGPDADDEPRDAASGGEDEAAAGTEGGGVRPGARSESQAYERVGRLLTETLRASWEAAHE